MGAGQFPVKVDIVIVLLEPINNLIQFADFYVDVIEVHLKFYCHEGRQYVVLDHAMPQLVPPTLYIRLDHVNIGT